MRTDAGPPPVAVHTRDLTRRFGDVLAVDRLNLRVDRGEMFGLVGPDGAGKTTTIRMLAGIIPPSSGTAAILGHDVLTEIAAVKRSIGYLSQRFTLYGDLSVDENIEFFAEIHGVRSYRTRREELLAFTRLTPFRDRLAERLSGGMKQKLALACTLIHTPELIFLDEPTTGVDPVSRRDFWRILQVLSARGVTIVMSTPYLDEAERCTRVALMHRGRLMLMERPAVIRESMSGEVFEVVCDPVRQAAALLRGAPGLGEMQTFGDRLNVITPQGADAERRIRRMLDDGGITVSSVRRIRPTLENVFISLLTHSDNQPVVP